MSAGGSSNDVPRRRLVQGHGPQLSGGTEPYQLRRGDCARVKLRDEWALIVKDASVLAYLSRVQLARKLLEAAKLIGELRGKA